MKRRLSAVLAALALLAGLGTAAARHAQAATAATAATGPIAGYQGLCLDDRSASTASGNPVQVYTCNGTSAQQWTVESNNTLQVLGKCLDVNAAGTANGRATSISRHPAARSRRSTPRWRAARTCCSRPASTRSTAPST